MAAREPFRLGGREIAPGSRGTLDLPVSVLSNHMPVGLAAHVIHGRRAGPVMFVSAGVHGDEVIGVEIVRRLLAMEQLARLAGTLIAIPIVNMLGFLAHSRYLPDRRDLNRAFPGYSDGSLAARLAHLMMSEIVSRADVGIDLHSAAIHRHNLPQIRISPESERARELARAFGAPVILEAGLRAGSLRAAAREAGVEVLLFEGGEGLRFDEMTARAGVSGILRVMRHLGMIPARGVSRPRRSPVLCRESRWLRAPQGGLVRFFRATGEVVAAGDVLAAVAGPFGETEAPLISPAGGIIIGRAVMPVVNEGDALVHLGAIASAEHAERAVEALTGQLSADPLFDEDEII
mgnify:CR=1 FL=1